VAGPTFAAKRIVCEHVQSVGGIDHVDVGNKQLLLYCASARHKYTAYLEDQNNHRSKVVAGEKRIALSDEASEFRVRRTLQTDAEALSASADHFADQAEKLQKIPLLAKRHATSSKRESRPTEGTEPAYR